jgi:hypothetical protein
VAVLLVAVMPGTPVSPRDLLRFSTTAWTLGQSSLCRRRIGQKRPSDPVRSGQPLNEAIASGQHAHAVRGPPACGRGARGFTEGQVMRVDGCVR